MSATEKEKAYLITYNTIIDDAQLGLGKSKENEEKRNSLE